MAPLAPLLLAALALAALPACSLPKETAAEVNGRPVPTAELEAEVRAFASSFGPLPPEMERELPRLRRGILERLISRELMLQEAERRGIRPSEAEVEQALARRREDVPDREFEASLADAGLDLERWRRLVRRDLVVERLQEAITAEVAVSEQEVSDWLARHRGTGERPDQVRASQLLVRTLEEAEAARRKILAGEPFGAVAREVSLSPDAERGGDLGYFGRGQMPVEFDEALYALAPGELSPVVETAWGFHLFLLTDRKAAHTRSEGEVREEARATILAAKREELFQRWLAGARAAANVRHNEAVVPE